jgi:hypothetical protein
LVVIEQPASVRVEEGGMGVERITDSVDRV